MLRPQRLSIPIAVVGVLALASLLSGCGRKGSLDAPPGGYQLEKDTSRTPASNTGKPRTQEQPADKDPEYDEQGRPIAPAGSRRKLPGDWLID